MAQTVPEMVLQPKKTVPMSKRKRMLMRRTKKPLVKKKKERVKKTLTKKPKEKRVKKRKTVRERRKRKETTKFSCLLSPNLVISYYIYQIRHLIIISPLQKKGQIEIDCVSSKSTPIQTREMPDQFPTIHKTTEHLLTKRKEYPKRWCFLSNKTKKNPFFPHLKQKN